MVDIVTSRKAKNIGKISCRKPQTTDVFVSYLVGYNDRTKLRYRLQQWAIGTP